MIAMDFVAYFVGVDAASHIPARSVGRAFLTRPTHIDPLHRTTETHTVTTRAKPVIPSQSADWRGNPRPHRQGVMHGAAKGERIAAPVTSVTGSQ